jgi:hypothetical protein
LSVAEDGVVDNDAVDGGVVVGVNERVFEGFAIYFSKVEGEATTQLSVSTVVSADSAC